jgi:hypothetical protein
MVHVVESLGKLKTMASAGDYEERIQRLDDWGKLRTFWQAVKERDTPGWSEGTAFEYLYSKPSISMAGLFDGLILSRSKTR